VQRGNRVYVGCFDADGWLVGDGWDDVRHDYLGLASDRTS
jgi:hypothetical protein